MSQEKQTINKFRDCPWLSLVYWKKSVQHFVGYYTLTSPQPHLEGRTVFACAPTTHPIATIVNVVSFTMIKPVANYSS
jgi:hypothetical protein